MTVNARKTGKLCSLFGHLKVAMRGNNVLHNTIAAQIQALSDPRERTCLGMHSPEIEQVGICTRACTKGLAFGRHACLTMGLNSWYAPEQEACCIKCQGRFCRMAHKIVKSSADSPVHPECINTQPHMQVQVLDTGNDNQLINGSISLILSAMPFETALLAKGCSLPQSCRNKHFHSIGTLLSRDDT